MVENFFGVMDNAFEVITGMAPTMSNYCTVALDTAFILAVICGVFHFFEVRIYNSLTREQQEEVNREIYHR